MTNTARSFKKLLFLIPAVMFAACGSDQGDSNAIPASVPPGEEYVVGFGETIHVGKLLLEFTTLAEDSRCPASAICAWEGNVRVLITATRGRATTVLELNLNPRFPIRATFEGYLIELRGVEPYPPTPAPIPVQDYAATLFVDAAQS